MSTRPPNPQFALRETVLIKASGQKGTVEVIHETGPGWYRYMVQRGADAATRLYYRDDELKPVKEENKPKAKASGKISRTRQAPLSQSDL